MILEDRRLTVVLLILIAILGITTVNKNNVGAVVLDSFIEPLDVDIKDNEININSLTLKQKIGQMIFSIGVRDNKEVLQEMNIGGIYFWKKDSANIYKEEIDYFQRDAQIPFLVGLDLEGCWNPFGDFSDFPKFNEIETTDEAYDVGADQGRLMRELGFNINFSPVVDRDDTIWNCRNFVGDVEGKSLNYIKGLQGQGIMATAKHYPGKTLIGRDPHKEVEFSVIEEDDLKPFKWAKNNNVKAVMINHLIATGVVDSGSSPNVVSGRVIGDLKKDYDGLVLSDEVGMVGLSGIYENNERQMYIDLVNAGNDVILDFRAEPWHLFKVVSIIENAVENGEIDENRIDDAVIKILKMKGFKVKRKV